MKKLYRMTYSIEVRSMVRRLLDHSFTSHRRLSRVLGISHSTISRWVKTDFVIKHRKEFIRKSMPSMIDLIKTMVGINPTTTLKEIASRLNETLNIKLSTELIRLCLHSAKMSYKRIYRYGISSLQSEKVSYFEKRRDSMISEGYTFLSIDETGIGRSTVLNKGWGAIGERLCIRKKLQNVGNTSVCAAVSDTGVVLQTSIKGSFNSSKFCDFLQELPITGSEKVCVLMDNVAFHHSINVLDILSLKGYVWLFVPPYSPEYNPIEGVFSCFKYHIKTGKSIKDAWIAIPKSVYVNNFRHSIGYKSGC